MIVAAEVARHTTAFGYVLALGLPLAGPVLGFAYWIAKGCPHVDD